MADLFKCLDALDAKNYDYYDQMDADERKSLSPYILLMWISYLKNNGAVSEYYVMSANCNANLYFFNEHISKHPKLQWMMLCSVSPDMGKQFRKWVPQLSGKFANLTEPIKMKDALEYFKKLNTTESKAKDYVVVQNKQAWLAANLPHMKLDDIRTLSQIITDEEIARYEDSKGM